MARNNKKPKVGDVVIITTSKGYAYAQLTHVNKLFGYLIRVYPQLHSRPVKEVCQITERPEAYSTFIHRLDFYAEPHITIIASCPIRPESTVFPMFRDGIKDPAIGKVERWWLWDGEVSTPVGELTEDMKRLSIREMDNYETLIAKIEAGWMPSMEC